MNLQYPAGWISFFEKWIDELDAIADVLITREIIRPPFKSIMRPFKETSLSSLKVVIIGQDPYPHPFSADGLAFSITEKYFISKGFPPSLNNIISEIEKDGKTSLARKYRGDLSCWSKQGVLLLNSALTMEPNKMRHDFLWRGFVKDCLRECSKKGKVVFMLWGREARKFDKEIDKSKNLVLFAHHPSPRNTTSPFVGCNHFIEANEYLSSRGLSEIEW